jgi:hypothetical protein
MILSVEWLASVQAAADRHGQDDIGFQDSGVIDMDWRFELIIQNLNKKNNLCTFVNESSKMAN